MFNIPLVHFRCGTTPGDIVVAHVASSFKMVLLVPFTSILLMFGTREVTRNGLLAQKRSMLHAALDIALAKAVPFQKVSLLYKDSSIWCELWFILNCKTIVLLAPV